MGKAYCMVLDIRPEIILLLEQNGIEVVVHPSSVDWSEPEFMNMFCLYDILIIGSEDKISKDLLLYIQKPIVIATLSVGVDHICQEVAECPLVRVIHLKTANALSVAEHIFSLILALNKRVCEANQLVLDGRAHKHHLRNMPEDISHKKLGLIGAGHITREVINIAKAFQMKMICYTDNPSASQDLVEKGVVFTSLDSVLRESDIINISIPLTDKTRFFISEDEISLMKPTATFINTARRDVVDTRALIEYADANPTFCVGLDIDLDNYKDVFEQYRANVIVTPHIAGSSRQARNDMWLELVQKILDYVKGV
ncbi:MAG: NAD(P)-dependent oxidoreductase [bacterium]|nr:NAD(P)-dependent oxidoreductase [bacterium]